MRRIPAVAAIVALALALGSAAAAAPPLAPRDAALKAGDWRRAAELGASAADVVRAVQAKGRFADMVAEESVVTIGPDNSLDVVALKPLPPLDGAASGDRTAGLSGSGFAFSANAGSIVLYPTYAQSFAAQQPVAQVVK
jgi:hypothetical protein